MKISDRGLAFVAGHEGLVLTAYRDVAGVLTIGYGFTMRSALFRDFWNSTRKHSLKLGDKLTHEEADLLLRKLLDEEYGPAVTLFSGNLAQHQFDAAVSAVYNLGKKAIRWRWGKALRAGDIAAAAEILRKNYNTAGGEKLQASFVVERRRLAFCVMAIMEPTYLKLEMECCGFPINGY